jgi:hypothetical protein
MDNARPDIQILYSDGKMRLREALTIVFYIRKPHLKIKQKIERAIWGFVNLVSIEALPEYFNDEGDQEELTKESLTELIYERFHGPYSAQNAAIELNGRGMYAPDYYLRYIGNSLEIEEFPDEVSCLWCWIPREFYLKNTKQVVEFIMSLAEDLPFTFAYAAMGLSGEDEYRKQALAKRHPGLDIADPASICFDIGNKAAGSYWLTLIGPELCQAVGGIDALRAGLPKEISVGRTSRRKCRILLGEQPEIGDVNRRSRSRCTKPLQGFFHDKGELHVPEWVVYFKDKDGMADRDAMEAWHKRFLD